MEREQEDSSLGFDLSDFALDEDPVPSPEPLPEEDSAFGFDLNDFALGDGPAAKDQDLVKFMTAILEDDRNDAQFPEEIPDAERPEGLSVGTEEYDRKTNLLKTRWASADSSEEKTDALVAWMEEVAPDQLREVQSQFGADKAPSVREVFEKDGFAPAAVQLAKSAGALAGKGLIGAATAFDNVTARPARAYIHYKADQIRRKAAIEGTIHRDDGSTLRALGAGDVLSPSKGFSSYGVEGAPLEHLNDPGYLAAYDRSDGSMEEGVQVLKDLNLIALTSPIERVIPGLSGVPFSEVLGLAGVDTQIGSIARRLSGEDDPQVWLENVDKEFDRKMTVGGKQLTAAGYELAEGLSSVLPMLSAGRHPLHSTGLSFDRSISDVNDPDQRESQEAERTRILGTELSLNPRLHLIDPLEEGGITASQWEAAEAAAVEAGGKGGQEFVGLIAQIMTDPIMVMKMPTIATMSGVRKRKAAVPKVEKVIDDAVDDFIGANYSPEEWASMDSARQVIVRNNAKADARAEFGIKLMEAANVQSQYRLSKNIDNIYGVESVQLLDDLKSPVNAPVVDDILRKAGIDMVSEQPARQLGEAEVFPRTDPRAWELFPPEEAAQLSKGDVVQIEFSNQLQTPEGLAVRDIVSKDGQTLVLFDNFPTGIPIENIRLEKVPLPEQAALASKPSFATARAEEAWSEVMAQAIKNNEVPTGFRSKQVGTDIETGKPAYKTEITWRTPEGGELKTERILHSLDNVKNRIVLSAIKKVPALEVVRRTAESIVFMPKAQPMATRKASDDAAKELLRLTELKRTREIEGKTLSKSEEKKLELLLAGKGRKPRVKWTAMDEGPGRSVIQHEAKFKMGERVQLAMQRAKTLEAKAAADFMEQLERTGASADMTTLAIKLKELGRHDPVTAAEIERVVGLDRLDDSLVRAESGDFSGIEDPRLRSELEGIARNEGLLEEFVQAVREGEESYKATKEFRAESWKSIRLRLNTLRRIAKETIGETFAREAEIAAFRDSQPVRDQIDALRGMRAAFSDLIKNKVWTNERTFEEAMQNLDAFKESSFGEGGFIKGVESLRRERILPEGSPEDWSAFREEVYFQLSQAGKKQGLSEEQVDMIMAIADARSRTWAEWHRLPEEDSVAWFSKTFSDFPVMTVKEGRVEGLERAISMKTGGVYGSQETAYVQFLKDGRATLGFVETANLNKKPDQVFTGMVEALANVFFKDLPDVDRAVFDKWARSQLGESVKNSNGQYKTKAGATFSRAFVRHLKTGELPKGFADQSGIKELFSKMKEWLLDLYVVLTGSKPSKLRKPAYIVDEKLNEKTFFDDEYIKTRALLGSAWKRSKPIKISKEMEDVFNRLLDPASVRGEGLPVVVEVDDAIAAMRGTSKASKGLAALRLQAAVRDLFLAAGKTSDEADVLFSDLIARSIEKNESALERLSLVKRRAVGRSTVSYNPERIAPPKFDSTKTGVHRTLEARNKVESKVKEDLQLGLGLLPEEAQALMDAEWFKIYKKAQKEHKAKVDAEKKSLEEKAEAERLAREEAKIEEFESPDTVEGMIEEAGRFTIPGQGDKVFEIAKSSTPEGGNVPSFVFVKEVGSDTETLYTNLIPEAAAERVRTGEASAYEHLVDNAKPARGLADEAPPKAATLDLLVKKGRSFYPKGADGTAIKGASPVYAEEIAGETRYVTSKKIRGKKTWYEFKEETLGGPRSAVDIRGSTKASLIESLELQAPHRSLKAEPEAVAKGEPETLFQEEVAKARGEVEKGPAPPEVIESMEDVLVLLDSKLSDYPGMELKAARKEILGDQDELIDFLTAAEEIDDIPAKYAKEKWQEKYAESYDSLFTAKLGKEGGESFRSSNNNLRFFEVHQDLARELAEDLYKARYKGDDAALGKIADDVEEVFPPTRKPTRMIIEPSRTEEFGDYLVDNYRKMFDELSNAYVDKHPLLKRREAKIDDLRSFDLDSAVRLSDEADQLFDSVKKRLMSGTGVDRFDKKISSLRDVSRRLFKEVYDRNTVSTLMSDLNIASVGKGGKEAASRAAERFGQGLANARKKLLVKRDMPNVEKAAEIASIKGMAASTETVDQASEAVKWIDRQISRRESLIAKDMSKARNDAKRIREVVDGEEVLTPLGKKLEEAEAGIRGASAKDPLERALEALAPDEIAVGPRGKTRPKMTDFSKGPDYLVEELTKSMDETLTSMPMLKEDIMRSAKDMGYDLRTPGQLWDVMVNARKYARSYGDELVLRRKMAVEAFRADEMMKAYDGLTNQQKAKVHKLLANRKLYGVGENASKEIKGLAKSLGMTGNEELFVTLKRGRVKVGDHFTPEEIETSLKVAKLLDDLLDNEYKKLVRAGKFQSKDPTILAQIDQLKGRLLDESDLAERKSILNEIAKLESGSVTVKSKEEFLSRVDVASYMPHLKSVVARATTDSLAPSGIGPAKSAFFEKFRTMGGALDDINEQRVVLRAIELLNHAAFGKGDLLYEVGAPLQKFNTPEGRAIVSQYARGNMLDNLMSVDEWDNAIKWSRKHLVNESINRLFEADLGILIKRYLRQSSESAASAAHTRDIYRLNPLGAEIAEYTKGMDNAQADLVAAKYGFARLSRYDSLQAVTGMKLPPSIKYVDDAIVDALKTMSPTDASRYLKDRLNIDITPTAAAAYLTAERVFAPIPYVEYVRWMNQADFAQNWPLAKAVYDGFASVWKGFVTIASLAHVSVNVSGNYASIGQKIGPEVFNPANHADAMTIFVNLDKEGLTAFKKAAGVEHQDYEVTLGLYTKTVKEWRQIFDEVGITEAPLQRMYLEDIGGTSPGADFPTQQVAGSVGATSLAAAAAYPFAGPLGAAAAGFVAQYPGSFLGEIWKLGYGSDAVKNLQAGDLAKFKLAMREGWKRVSFDEMDSLRRAIPSGSGSLKESIKYFSEKSVGMALGATAGSVFGPAGAAAGAIAGMTMPSHLKMMTGLNQAAETQARITLAVGELRKGKTIDEAAESVDFTLRNYGHLTPFEKHVLRRIFFFWTWDAGNMRFQMNQLVTNPRQAAVLSHYVNGIMKGSFDEEDIGSMPENLRWKLLVETTPGKFAQIPGLGQTAAAEFTGRVTQGPSGVIPSLMPHIQMPIELISGKSFFYDRSWNELTNASKLKDGPDWVKSFVGFPMKWDPKKKEYVNAPRKKAVYRDGKKVGERDYYQMTKPLNYYLLTKMPGSRSLNDFISLTQDNTNQSIAMRGRETRKSGLERVGDYFGVKTRSIDTGAQRYFRQKDYQEELLRRIGVIDESIFRTIERASKRTPVGDSNSLNSLTESQSIQFQPIILEPR